MSPAELLAGFLLQIIASALGFFVALFAVAFGLYWRFK